MIWHFYVSPCVWQSRKPHASAFYLVISYWKAALRRLKCLHREEKTTCHQGAPYRLKREAVKKHLKGEHNAVDFTCPNRPGIMEWLTVTTSGRNRWSFINQVTHFQNPDNSLTVTVTLCGPTRKYSSATNSILYKLFIQYRICVWCTQWTHITFFSVNRRYNTQELTLIWI